MASIYYNPGQEQWTFPPIHSGRNITTGSFKLYHIAKYFLCLHISAQRCHLSRCGELDYLDPSPSTQGTSTGVTPALGEPTILPPPSSHPPSPATTTANYPPFFIVSSNITSHNYNTAYPGALNTSWMGSPSRWRCTSSISTRNMQH